MNIASDSKIKIEKFIDRCLTFNNYLISFYVVDMNSAELLLSTINHYYKSMAYEHEIKSIEKDSCIKISFANGSIIRIFTQQQMTYGVHAHLVYMDSRIKEEYIMKSIFPQIEKYNLENDTFMLNPKFIYIKYSEVNENETD